MEEIRLHQLLRAVGLAGACALGACAFDADTDGSGVGDSPTPELPDPSVSEPVVDTTGTDVVRPTALVVGEESPQHLIAVGESLYWIDRTASGSRLRSIAVDGESLTTVAESLPGDPFDMVGVADGVYWASDSVKRIFFTSFASGKTTDAFVTDRQPLALVGDEGFIYWTTADGCVMGGKLETGGQNVVACAGGTPIDLSLSGDVLYWSTVEGSIFAVSRFGGGDAEELVSHESFPAGITVDASWVFWVNDQLRQVRRLDRHSGEITVIATQQYVPAGLAADRFIVYFSTQADSSVKRVAKDGSVLTEIAVGQEQPGEVLVDDARIYWINEGAGAVMAIDK